jgi:hypothetical protein
MNERPERNPEKQDANLELNRETVQDLTEQEAEAAQGGLLAPVDQFKASGQNCCPTTYAH